MPHNDKISQRRLLLLDQICSQEFRSMASTDSGDPKKVDGIHRNRWSAWAGTGGRHPSEWVVGMGRITHIDSFHAGYLVGDW